MKKLLISMLIVLFSLPLQAQTTRPVGVWYQPKSSFAKWKQRGVNTLIGYDSGENTTLTDYMTTVKANGFKIILQDDAANDTSSYWNDPSCIAVSLPDEAMSNWVPTLKRPLTAGELLGRTGAIKQKCNKPVFLNFSGWNLQFVSDSDLVQYLATCDWVGIDWYVVNRGETMNSFPKVLTQIERIKRLAPGKPIWVALETSNQNLRVQDWLVRQPAQQALCRGPSTGEVVIQSKLLLQAGCILYIFPDTIGVSWENYDSTPLDVAMALPYLWN